MRPARLLTALSLAAISLSAQAVQYTIPLDVWNSSYGQGASYTGVGFEYGSGAYQAGAFSDGGYDAVDGFGYVSGLGSLSLNRRTEAIQSMNMYRFVDTFTNNTASTLTQTVHWWGNLGSDGYQNTYAGPGRSVINVDNNNYDPVGAYVYGNNAYATSNMAASWYCAPNGVYGCTDNLTVSTNLTVNPGQSVSLMYFAFYARDTSNRSGDVALATSQAAALGSSPYLTGLSSQEISRIANWGPGIPVPEPASLILMGLGLLGLGAARRRA